VFFGHVKQTFNRKSGLPTGNTEWAHPTARLNVDWRHPLRNEEEVERDRLQRELSKAPKAPVVRRAPPVTLPSPPVDDGWPIVAEQNGLCVRKRESRTNGIQYTLSHKSSGMSLGPIGPYSTRREAVAVLEAVAPLHSWTQSKEELGRYAPAESETLRRRVHDAVKEAVGNLPTQSKKPWQVTLFVIDPARPEIRDQRRFTVSPSSAKTRLDAIKEAVRQAVVQRLEYVDVMSAYQRY